MRRRSAERDRSSKRSRSPPPEKRSRQQRSPAESRREHHRRSPSSSSPRRRRKSHRERSRSPSQERERRQASGRFEGRPGNFRRRGGRRSSSPREEERPGGRRGVKREPDSADQRERRENEERRIERRRQRDREEGNNNENPFTRDSKQEYGWGKREGKEEPKAQEGEEEQEEERQKPNFGLSGKLAADTNTFNGVVVKYNQPPEARKPKLHWRLFPFKGDESLETLYIHRQSAYLVGRDRRVADLPVDHPSCSKQHAVLQYRAVPYERPDGSKGRRVRPYLIDLGSANGTFLNNQRLDPSRYYELKEKDVMKFGFSTREYVLMNETTKEDSEGAEQN